METGGGVGGAAAFDWVPDQIGAGRPFGVGLGERVRQRLEFVLLLEGGIDQHQAAPLVGRHEGRQRRPAVEIDHPRLAIAAQRVDQLLAGAGLDFATLKKQAQTREFKPVELKGLRLSASYAVDAQVITIRCMPSCPKPTRVRASTVSRTYPLPTSDVRIQ